MFHTRTMLVEHYHRVCEFKNKELVTPYNFYSHIILVEIFIGEQDGWGSIFFVYSYVFMTNLLLSESHDLSRIEAFVAAGNLLIVFGQQITIDTE